MIKQNHLKQNKFKSQQTNKQTSSEPTFASAHVVARFEKDGGFLVRADDALFYLRSRLNGLLAHQTLLDPWGTEGAGGHMTARSEQGVPLGV